MPGHQLVFKHVLRCQQHWRTWKVTSIYIPEPSMLSMVALGLGEYAAPIFIPRTTDDSGFSREDSTVGAALICKLDCQHCGIALREFTGQPRV